MSSFDRSLAQGQVGEGVISKWLQDRGHAVFPAYQLEQQTGKGPQLFTADGDLVLPDMLVFKGRQIIWAEAKHKTCFTWHRNTGRWTTGIDLRHYDEYQKVADRTGLPVWLLFWHPQAAPNPRDVEHGCPATCPTGLFGNDISELANCENHRSKPYDATRQGYVGHGRSGMVYWAESSLKKLAEVAA